MNAMKKMNLLPVVFLFSLLVIVSCRSHSPVSTGEKSFPVITDDSLMNLVEYRTLQYFWDGAEPNSGMARERFHSDNIYPENDKNIVTTGGTGFGLMALVVGTERGFITRLQAMERFTKIVGFL